MADLRMASQPRNNWKTINRNVGAGVTTITSMSTGVTQTIVREGANQEFQVAEALYMEPSAFNYAQLKNQRQNAYDNFLRSNIDNEQDNRNFNTEPGKDHLPFRTYEGAATDQPLGLDVETKLPAGAAITATPGTPFLIPLRWNNPHASELEVNIWIMKPQATVVPVKKPTCSGEGHQDNVFEFTVPADFNNLGSKVPGFTGCKTVGDCVLQIYAHSVETRQYSMGTPLIVPGNVPAATATDRSQIAPTPREVGTNLDQLKLDICRPSSDPAANIATAAPQEPRHVSDVFNHAYQNSDYSPYAGQQPRDISRNLQAAAILKMVTGNRGELGKALLAQENPAAAAYRAQLNNQVNNLIQAYEGVTNAIINGAQRNGNVANSGTVSTAASNLKDPNTPQKTAQCFRCDEVGAVTRNRLTTNTYVPSFKIPAAQVAAAEARVPAQYANILKKAADGSATLQLYEGVLQSMGKAFALAESQHKLTYQPAVVEPLANGLATLKDATGFRKVNAAGRPDNGIYAAKQAKALLAQLTPAGMEVTDGVQGLQAYPDLQGFEAAGLETPSAWVIAPLQADQTPAETMIDDEGTMCDSECDDDAKWAANPEMNCVIPAGTCAGSAAANQVGPNVAGGLSAAPANTANLPLALAAAAIAAGAALQF